MTSCFIGCFCSAYQRDYDATLALPPIRQRVSYRARL